MTTCRRSGYKWTINELLSLQREYELLSLPINDIAERHGRSFFSILSKLKSEGFIDDETYHKEVMSNRHGKSSDFNIDASVNDTSTVTENATDLNDRIGLLETAVNNISASLSKLLTSVYGKNSGISYNGY